MQAIVTKYLPPTDTRGARVIAKCDAGRIVVAWDGRINDDENHEQAARELAKKLGWDQKRYYGEMVGGGLPRGMGGNVYVFHKRR